MAAPVALLLFFAFLVASQSNKAKENDPPQDDTAIWADLLRQNSSSPAPVEYEYFKGLSDPLAPNTLELGLDIDNLSEYSEYDFEPVQLAVKLMSFARADNNTTPGMFLEEMRELIKLKDRLMNEAKQLDERIEEPPSEEPPSTPSVERNWEKVYEYDRFGRSRLVHKLVTPPPPITVETTEQTVDPINPTDDDWKNNLRSLENKYNISSECDSRGSSLECISFTRLKLMFPHFLNFGQKPYASPVKTPINATCGRSTLVVAPYPVDNGMGVYDYTYHPTTPPPPPIECLIPSFFTRPEFGGLIPRTGLINEQNRRMIIALHLHSMYSNQMNGPTPFRTKMILLKWRMEKSLLSDERKIRFLRNNDVISLNDLDTDIMHSYLSVPTNFLDRIDWSLFE